MAHPVRAKAPRPPFWPRNSTSSTSLPARCCAARWRKTPRWDSVSDIVVGLIARALDHGRNELIDEWDELRLRRACGIGPDDPLPEKPQPSIIYDGFPRTVQQCQMLEFLFQKKQRKLDAVISIDVPQEELVHRIHERALVSNRSDDTEDVIRHRLEEYEAKTRPVLDYYKVSGRLVSIDGSGKITETNTRLCQVMEYIMSR